ncbi:MAG: hypothetical protein AUG16_03155 [Thaumarchaeota archaeon 13_1_20CM_2_39_20]|nr:MAG: hypothetical protein AUG16_03155 [Thaumarchaeota archaeon 13_1_20CM_2_39_20]
MLTLLAIFLLGSLQVVFQRGISGKPQLLVVQLTLLKQNKLVFFLIHSEGMFLHCLAYRGHGISVVSISRNVTAELDHQANAIQSI